LPAVPSAVLAPTSPPSPATLSIAVTSDGKVVVSDLDGSEGAVTLFAAPAPAPRVLEQPGARAGETQRMVVSMDPDVMTSTQSASSCGACRQLAVNAMRRRPGDVPRAVQP
jgi:streptogramin lyase